jgi:hypothetical protein
MRWFLLLAVFALLPGVLADGWYYEGDTFTQGGILYSVEGFGTHEKVLLGVGSTSYIIPLGECVTQGFSSYCYEDTGFPNDDAHLKYSAGKIFYAYYITIATDAPEVTVERTATKTKLAVGEETTIAVKIKNTGDYSVEDLVYREPIPAGMATVSTYRVGEEIVYTSNVLPLDGVQLFSYALRAEDYVNAQTRGNLTYSYNGKAYGLLANTLTFTVDTPLEVKRGIRSSIPLGEGGTYMINISNKDAVPMTAKIAFTIPPSFIPGEHPFTLTANGTYMKEVTIPAYTNLSFALPFTTREGGSFRIPLDVVAQIRGSTITKHYDDATSVQMDKIRSSITASSSRTTFFSGEKLTVSGVLENVNDKITFKSISGVLSAPGLFPDKRFSHEAFGPDRKLTEAEIEFVFPEVNATTSYAVTFSGSYTTPIGQVIDFSSTKALSAKPFIKKVDLTATVDPVPAPGKNVTITVDAKNLWGKYMIFNAHESYVNAVRAGGVTFIEGSLEKDKSQKLYTYILEIPANATGNLSITTTFTVKDELSETLERSYFLAAIPGETAGNTSSGAVLPSDSAQDTIDAVEENGPGAVAAVKGFFTDVWDFIKNLF